MSTADATSAARSDLIRLEQIHKIYDMGRAQVHALRGVSLRVTGGEFVAVMGASGSGKSTLMNIIGCLDKQSSGEYFLDGTNVSQLDKHAVAAIRNRKLGFVFQGFNLIARTTALENVAMPTLYSRMSKHERMRRAMKAISMVGLEQQKDRFPSQMSGGQQQRVAIARALVNDPSILIADEPTGNLDSRTSMEIIDVLQGLNNQGLTVVMVTHESDIAQFAKRTILIRDGLMRKDEAVADRLNACDVLRTLPVIPTQP
jgi:putative ABC transport system ATP-binding protein